MRAGARVGAPVRARVGAGGRPGSGQGQWAGRGECARGAGLPLLLRLLPAAAAAAVQFSRNPTGAAFAERIRPPGSPSGPPGPAGRCRREEGVGAGGGGRAGGEGRGKRAWPERSLLPVSGVPGVSGEWGSPWSPGLGAPAPSQGLGELGVG